MSDPLKREKEFEESLFMGWPAFLSFRPGRDRRRSDPRQEPLLAADRLKLGRTLGGAPNSSLNKLHCCPKQYMTTRLPAVSWSAGGAAFRLNSGHLLIGYHFRN